MEKGADINAATKNGWTPLGVALAYDKLDLGRFLLSKGATVDILAAATLGDAERVRALLKEKPERARERDPGGVTPLHRAALHGHLEIAKALIEAGADVNAADRRGHTQLHTAVKAGHKDIAQLLLDKGAKINAQNIVGRTALHFAVWRGYNELVELLLARGADPALKDVQGQTPLDQAKQLANERAVKLLQAASNR